MPWSPLVLVETVPETESGVVLSGAVETGVGLWRGAGSNLSDGTLHGAIFTRARVIGATLAAADP